MRDLGFLFSFDCYCLELPGQETSAFLPIKKQRLPGFS